MSLVLALISTSLPFESSQKTFYHWFWQIDEYQSRGVLVLLAKTLSREDSNENDAFRVSVLLKLFSKESMKRGTDGD